MKMSSRRVNLPPPSSPSALSPFLHCILASDPTPSLATVRHSPPPPTPPFSTLAQPLCVTARAPRHIHTHAHPPPRRSAAHQLPPSLFGHRNNSRSRIRRLSSDSEALPLSSLSLSLSLFLVRSANWCPLVFFLVLSGTLIRERRLGGLGGDMQHDSE